MFCLEKDFEQGTQTGWGKGRQMKQGERAHAARADIFNQTFLIDHLSSPPECLSHILTIFRHSEMAKKTQRKRAHTVRCDISNLST